MVLELALELIIIPLLFCLITSSSSAAAAISLAKPGCQESCGNVTIPYPFGIGENCYLDQWYQINCNQFLKKPFLDKVNMEVLSISLTPMLVVLNSHITSSCNSVYLDDIYTSSVFRGSPFQFSASNKFTVVGCDTGLLLRNSTGELWASCTPICIENYGSSNAPMKGCYGINCCQTPIPSGLDTYEVAIRKATNISTALNCSYSFLVAGEWFPGEFLTPAAVRERENVPVEMEWMITNLGNVSEGKFLDYYCSRSILQGWSTWGTTYRCQCQHTFEGNPYIYHGCKVVEVCANCRGRCASHYTLHDDLYITHYYCDSSSKSAVVVLGLSIGMGFLVLLIGSVWLGKAMRKMRNTKLKKRFFKRNGGLLLQQQMLSDEGVVEKTKIFTSKELEKATNNFNENRILGQGGQGTVYKGMLTDGRIVAIKKSKLVDESQLEQFINEVVILSQINHRNVVKLLGCCLETEVPLLVYEFISNGNLYQLIHNQNEDFPLSWKMRLQIATEVAGALSYLHSAASMPIYHRDIKSTNILLDDTYRAKVSDFGSSRSVSIDKTHITTIIQGTFGYLDPQYFQSSQLTEKSDVYSFGVVLVELLTGQKPITFSRSQEAQSLAAHFIESLKETCLFDILDAWVIKEGRKEEIMAVANLANRCLSWNGKKRPTMKEVTTELEVIRMSNFSLDVHPILYDTI